MKTLCIILVVLRIAEGIYIPGDSTIKPQYVKKEWRKIALQPEVTMHHNYSRVYFNKQNSIIDQNRQEKSLFPDDQQPEKTEILQQYHQSNNDQIQIHDKLEFPQHDNYKIDPGVAHNPPLAHEIQVHGFHYPPRPSEVYPFVNEIKPYSNMAFEKCPHNVTGQLAYLWSCSQFINCWKGRGHIQNCAPGTKFNPETLECDFPYKVDCISGAHNQKVKYEKYVAEESNKNICGKDFSGLLPHPNDCAKFINCANGLSYVQDCGPGTVFNTAILACDFPYNTKCGSYYLTEEEVRMAPISSNQNSNYENYQRLPTLREIQTHDHTRHGHQYNLRGNTATNQHQQRGCSQNECQGSQSNTGNYQEGVQTTQQFGDNQQPTSYTPCPPNGCQQGTHINQQHYGNNQQHESHQQFGETVCPPNQRNCKQDQPQPHYNYGSQPQPQYNYESQTQEQNYHQHRHQGQSGTHSPRENVHNVATTSWTRQNSKNSQYIQSHSNTKQEIKCPTSHSGLLPHPFICEKFLNCANGVTYIQDCGPGTVFNPNSKVCDWPYNVKCTTKSSENINSKDLQPSSTSTDYPSSTGRTTGYTRIIGHRRAHTNTNIQSGSSNLNSQQSGSQPGYQDSTSTNFYNQQFGITPHSQYGNVNRQPVVPVNQQPGSQDGTRTQTGYIPVAPQSQYDNVNRQSGSLDGTRTHTGYTPVAPQSQYDYVNRQPGSQDGTRTHTGYIPVAPQSQYDNVNRQPGSQDGTRTQTGYTPVTPHSQYDNVNRQPGFQDSTRNHTGYSPIGPNSQHGNVNRQPVVPINQQPGSQDGTRTHTGYTPIVPNSQYGNVNRQTEYQHSSRPQSNTNTFNSQYGGSVSRQPAVLNRPQTSTNYTSSTHTQSSYIPSTFHTQQVVSNSQYGNIGNPVGHTTTQYSNHPTSSGTVHSSTFNTQQYGNPLGQIPSQYGNRPIASGTTLQNGNHQIQHHPSGSGNAGYQNHDYSYQNRDKIGPQPIELTSSITVVNNTKKIGSSHWPAPFPSTDTSADYYFEETTTPTKNRNIKKVWKTGNSCLEKEFECDINECIPNNWVCDGNQDCSNGLDEKNCTMYLQKFTMTSNSRLYKHEKEKWLNTNLETCANYCLNSSSFLCKSFNFRKDENVCLLCDTNVGLSGALASSQLFDYYELSDLTVNCTGMYECNNQKCINFSQVCDGTDDCGNRMDEKKCSAETLGFDIKLAGSQFKNEGRVEVKVFGEWGFICDDKFGLRNADVICKELGYHQGALEVKIGSHFAKDITDNETFYLMDDVQCIGNETTIRDCDFSGWGVHNCMPQEIAGIICKTDQQTCPAEHWKCDTTNECLPLQFVCDGVFDCNDHSDEGSQHCEAPIELRLMNGSSKLEGRVEVRYHGVWGTICDDDFNDQTAKVICRSLGYQGSAVAKKEGAFGAGMGPIWLDQVNCFGNESFIEDCFHWNWGENNCEHSEDAGVVCSNIDASEFEKKSRTKDILDISHVKPIPEEIFTGSCGHTGQDLFNENDNSESEIHFRVVQGSTARKGEYPWQATLRIKGKSKSTHWCGAVILSNKFVLTAAHCLVGFPKGSYVLRAGDYNVNEDEGTEVEAYIEDFFVHERFRQGGHMNNDIAVIKLKGVGLRLSKQVQPICLPEKDSVYKTGLNCTISGFGSTESGKSTSSHILRAGWVRIQSNDICKMEQVYGNSITDGMFCAGSLDEGVDSCDGDSGGPLACLNKGLFTLYGLTSWGQRCGHANKPGVYVKVSHYRDWIDKIVQDNS